VNARAGEPVDVSAVTADLVALAVEKWRATEGWFDPTILPSLMAAGYDRSFDEGLEGPEPAETTAAPGCEGIVVAAGTVLVPAGVALDLGGIGKGRAADLVIDELADAGVQGACVNLGGDLRAVGQAPDGASGWGIAIDDPLDPTRSLVTIGLAQGALATSSIAKRRWARRDGTVAHHLIDPRTGRPSSSDVVSATVIADTAVDAEVLAKVAVMRGNAPVAAPALLAHADGRTTEANGVGSYFWSELR
jgi:thiamine biosynthesis lipoprotein